MDDYSVRILYLTSYFRSGQTTHLFTLAGAIRRRGHQVHVVVGGVRSAYQRRYTMALAQGIPCSTGLDLRRLIRLVRREKIDIIHAHSKRTLFLAARLSQRTGVPLIITCHARTFIRPRFRRAFRQARFIICPWPELAHAFGRGYRKLRVIPNGIELDRFHAGRRQDRQVPQGETDMVDDTKPQQAPLRVLYLGRVDRTRVRGVRVLCQAVSDLPDVELSLATNLPRKVRVGKGGSVKYLGWLARPEKVLARHDVVVGTGRAVLEGMAMGCVALVLGEGWDGLVTPRNAKKLGYYNFIGRATRRRPTAGDIRRTLERLVSDDQLRSKLTAWGQKYVARRHDIREIADRTLALYRAAR